MTPSIGVGQFCAWNGGCLFLGRHLTAIPVHSHQAMQIVIGSNADHRIQAGEQAPWVSYSAAVIPSRQPHGLDVTASDIGIVILLEPETREGRAITQRYLRDGIAEVGSEPLADAAKRLFNAAHEHIDGRTAELAQAIVTLLAGGEEPIVTTDERILKAVAYIGEHLIDPISLDDVAAHACLSPSRFRHLFVEQIGMGLRPYILWRRFIRVWDLLMAGESLSSAAHSAGFADAAHLTRTTNRAFGFAPSSLVVSPAPLLTAPLTDRTLAGR